MKPNFFAAISKNKTTKPIGPSEDVIKEMKDTKKKTLFEKKKK